jgi:translation elongation factor EF-Ts
VDVVAKTNPKDRAALEAAQLASGKTVAQGLTELVNLIRENITLGRFARFESDAVVQYIHFDGKKAGMVALQGAPVSNPKWRKSGKSSACRSCSRPRLASTAPG